MVELLNKDSKTAVCKMLRELREIWTKSGKECMDKIRKRLYEQNGNVNG